MYSLSLLDDWDRTVREWLVGTEEEAKEIKEYIDKKIKDLKLEFQLTCEIDEIKSGDKEIIDDFFEDVLKYIEKENEERKEKNKNYVSSLNGVISNFDTTKVPNFSEMFRDCK